MPVDGGLRSIFRTHLPRVHFQSIESSATGDGIPDSNGCVDGVEFWVEYKQTTGWVVGLNPAQVAWIDRRHRAGGLVWVAVRRRHEGGPRKGDAIDTLWIFPGGLARELEETGLRLGEDRAAGVWRGGPSKWCWPEIAEVLISRPHSPML